MKKATLLLLLMAALLNCRTNRTADITGKKIDELITAYYQAERFNGTVLVANGGRVVYHNGFGLANREFSIANRPEFIFNLASITKTFTAVLTMELVQEGKLRLDQTISDFLPWYRSDISRKVTIHHLLTHSSGIPNFLQFPGFYPDKARDPMTDLEQFIKDNCSHELQFEPGTSFAYNNSGYLILSAIIQNVTGLSYEEALAKYILEPCAMTHTGIDRNSRIIENKVNGYTRRMDGSFENAPYWDRSWADAAGQMYSNVFDMLKYHEALLSDKLLSAKYKDMMFHPYFPAFGDAHYGYGWTLREVPDKDGRRLSVQSHEGGIHGFNTYFSRIPEKNQVVVLLNNTQDTPGKEISNAVFAILNGTEYALPKKPISLALMRKANQLGMEDALAWYDEVRAVQPDDFDFDERQLNSLGYALLREGRIDDAIAVFSKNVEVNAQSGNAHDSLADALLAKSDTTGAVLNYRKTLELEPNNMATRKKLEALAR
jgi:CubicO group peptidase (beta-lactamase class C family)